MSEKSLVPTIETSVEKPKGSVLPSLEQNRAPTFDPQKVLNNAFISAGSMDEVDWLIGGLSSEEGEQALRANAQDNRYQELAGLISENPGVNVEGLLSDVGPLSFEKEVTKKHAKTPSSATKTHVHSVFLRLGKDLEKFLAAEAEDDWIDYGVDTISAVLNILPYWDGGDVGSLGNIQRSNVFEGDTPGFMADPGEALRRQMLLLLDPELQGEEWEETYQTFLENVKDASSSLRSQNPAVAAEILASTMIFGRDAEFDWVWDAMAAGEIALGGLLGSGLRGLGKPSAISKGVSPADTIASLGNREHAVDVAATTGNVADHIPSAAKTGVDTSDNITVVGVQGDIQVKKLSELTVDDFEGPLGISPMTKPDGLTDAQWAQIVEQSPGISHFLSAEDVDALLDGPMTANIRDVHDGTKTLSDIDMRGKTTSGRTDTPPLVDVQEGTTAHSLTLIEDFDSQFSRIDALPSEVQEQAFEEAFVGLRRELDADLKDFRVNHTTGQIESLVGKKKGTGGFANEKVAKQQLKKRFPSFKFDVVQGNDGTWYGKFTRDTKTEGFGLDEIGQENLRGTWFSRYFMGAANQMAERNRELLRGIQNRAPKLQRRVQEALDPINRLSKVQKADLENVATWVRDSTDMALKTRIWKDNREYYMKFSDINGRPPKPEEIKAWSSYKEVMELDYHIRNRERRDFLVNQGYINLELNPGFSVNAKPVTRNNIRGEVWDPTELRFRNAEDVAETAEVYRLHKPYLDKNTGKRVVFVQGENGVRGPLDARVLPYNPGGHRVGRGKYFVKQDNVQEQNGVKVHLSPKTIVASRRGDSARKFAQSMNTIQDSVVRFRKDEISLDELNEVFAKEGQEGLASYDDWVKLEDEGEILTGVKFDTVRDGEPLTTIDEITSIDATVEGESFSEIWHRQERGFNATRRDRLLKNEYLEDAPTLRPLEAMHTTLGPVLSRGSLLNYRTRSVESWLTAARPHMTSAIKGHGELREFMSAEIKTGTGVKQALEIQRDIIKRNLHMNTSLRHMAEQAKEWVISRVVDITPSDYQKVVGRTLEDIALDTTFSPSQFMKAMAMNLKLGVFDPSQLVVQSQTALAAAAIDPTSWGKAAVDAPAVLLSRSFHQPDHIKWLSKLSKNPQEFIARHKAMEDSGIWDVAANTALLEYTPETMLASSRFRRNLNSALETSKFFYYEAERFNRTVGYMMAWERHKKRYPNAFKKPGSLSLEMKNSLLDEALGLSMDMDRSGQAFWQQGILGIPAQFMAYQFRLWEKVLTKARGDKGLTAAERARLGLSQLVYYGTAGVPVLSTAWSWTEQRADIPKEAEDIIGHGLWDGLLSWAFGRDVELSTRVGTGAGIDQFVREMMTNETGFIEAMTGPGGVIGAEVIGETYTAVRNSLRLLGHGEMPDSADWERVFRNAISVDRMLDARDVMLYGTTFNDNSGQPIMGRGNMAPADAVLVALGIPIGEANRMREQFLAGQDFSSSYRRFANMIMRRINEMETARNEGREEDVEKLVRTVEILMTSMPLAQRERIFNAEPKIASMVSEMIERTIQQGNRQARRAERDLKEQEDNK